MTTPLLGARVTKSGSAVRPFFGVVPALADNLGSLIGGAAEDNLVVLDPWPSQAWTLFDDHDRFVNTYFKTFRGTYFAGNDAHHDKNDYYWVTGRTDDVLNVSGYHMNIAEVESAMVAHPKVAGMVVVGMQHGIKGQGIYVCATFNSGVESSEALCQKLKQWARREIGPIATPGVIRRVPGLPKARSNEIMRRVLRKVAAAKYDIPGDISTLADPGVVQHLIETHRSMQVA